MWMIFFKKKLLTSESEIKKFSGLDNLQKKEIEIIVFFYLCIQYWEMEKLFKAFYTHEQFQEKLFH